MEVSASVVSAFSPRVTWAHNKAKAYQYAQGITPKGLRSHVDASDRCVRQGFNGLRGPKTNAFARAIAGDRGSCRSAVLLPSLASERKVVRMNARKAPAPDDDRWLPGGPLME